jgi:predicted AAA+ superfamily ATPase
MYRRNIEHTLHLALADTPVVLLNGARQTGKSTLPLKLAKDPSATELQAHILAQLGYHVRNGSVLQLAS